MRKFIIITLLSIFSLSIYADITREGNTFKADKSTIVNTQTPYTWEDKEGNKYPIYITKKGACYILKISKKTSKEYKYYLPKEIQKTIKKEYNENRK